MAKAKDANTQPKSAKAVSTTQRVIITGCVEGEKGLLKGEVELGKAEAQRLIKLGVAQPVKKGAVAQVTAEASKNAADETGAAGASGEGSDGEDDSDGEDE